MELLITVEEAKKYARIDNDYEDDVVEGLILFAEFYISGALDDNLPRKDPRIQTIAKIIVSDLYDKREFTELSGNKLSNSTRHFCSSAFQQIRMEMRRNNGSGSIQQPYRITDRA